MSPSSAKRFSNGPLRQCALKPIFSNQDVVRHVSSQSKKIVVFVCAIGNSALAIGIPINRTTGSLLGGVGGGVDSCFSEQKGLSMTDEDDILFRAGVKKHRRRVIQFLLSACRLKISTH